MTVTTPEQDDDRLHTLQETRTKQWDPCPKCGTPTTATYKDVGGFGHTDPRRYLRVGVLTCPRGC